MAKRGGESSWYRNGWTVAGIAAVTVAVLTLGVGVVASAARPDPAAQTSTYTPPPPLDTTLITDAPGAAVMQKLADVAATGRKPIVLALGSSVTYGTGVSKPAEQSWTGILRRSIEQYTPVDWITSGHVGYTARQLADEGFVRDAIEARPDVIFYETCTLNELNADGGFVALPATIDAFNRNIDELQRGLPDALIVVQSPNPRVTDIETAAGDTYTDYVAAVLSASRARGLLTVDITTALQQRADQYAGVRGIINTDGIHPQASGYQMWASELKKFLGIPSTY